MLKLKRLRTFAFLMPIVLVSLAQVEVFGQAEDGLEVQVPFSFVVENTTLPAGHYLIDRVMNNDLVAWKIQNVEAGGATVLFLTESWERPASTDRKSYVDFKAIGGEHYLSTFWFAGEPDGFHLMPGHSLLQAERNEKAQLRSVPASMPKAS